MGAPNRTNEQTRITTSRGVKYELKESTIPMELAEKRLENTDTSYLNEIGYRSPDVHMKTRSYPLHPDTCSKASNTSVILVFSPLWAFRSRMVIRQTWGDRLDLELIHSQLIFIVGVGDSSLTQKALIEESLVHRDILQIDFYDSYYNLTLKTLSALEWVSRHCKTPKFIAKIDDDNIVNIHNLFGGALNVSRLFDRFILGYTYSDFKPVNTTGKRFDPVYEVLYNQSYYPTFISGPGYVLTNNFLEELLQSCRNKPFIHLEDVFVNGICAEDVEGVVKASMPGFYMRKLSACEMKTDGFILSHGFTPESLLSTWRQYKTLSHLLR